MDNAECLLGSIYHFKNEFFYGERVHTYLIEIENSIILFDIPSFSLDNLIFVKSFNKPVIAILSHGPCGIHDGTKWQNQLNVQVYLNEFDKSNKWLKMTPNFLFTTPMFLSEEIEIIHTPGHSPGSVCLLHKATKSLFTGDTFQMDKKGFVMDFTDNHLKINEETKLRLDSCKKLLDYDFSNVFPFHYFYSIDNKAKKKLSNYIMNHNY